MTLHTPAILPDQQKMFYADMPASFYKIKNLKRAFMLSSYKRTKKYVYVNKSNMFSYDEAKQQDDQIMRYAVERKF